MVVMAALTDVGASLQYPHGDFVLTHPSTPTSHFPSNFVLFDPPPTLTYLQPTTPTAVSVKGHLDRQKRDYDAKYHLYTIESRVHRLARYYRRVKQLPAAWQYDSKTAKALVA